VSWRAPSATGRSSEIVLRFTRMGAGCDIEQFFSRRIYRGGHWRKSIPKSARAASPFGSGASESPRLPPKVAMGSSVSGSANLLQTSLPRHFLRYCHSAGSQQFVSRKRRMTSRRPETMPRRRRHERVSILPSSMLFQRVGAREQPQRRRRARSLLSASRTPRNWPRPGRWSERHSCASPAGPEPHHCPFRS
jgi:hypothetical protein